MKKGIRRYTAFVLACMLVSVMLAGCGEKSPSEKAAPAETAAQAEKESLAEAAQTTAAESTAAETGVA